MVNAPTTPWHSLQGSWKLTVANATVRAETVKWMQNGDPCQSSLRIERGNHQIGELQSMVITINVEYQLRKIVLTAKLKVRYVGGCLIQFLPILYWFVLDNRVCGALYGEGVWQCISRWSYRFTVYLIGHIIRNFPSWTF